MPSERFTKAHRVRRRGEFKRVFDLSLRMKGRYLTVLMAPNGAGDEAPGHRGFPQARAMRFAEIALKD